MKRIFFCLILAALNLSTSHAFAAEPAADRPKLELYQIIGSNKQKLGDWRMAGRWSWQPNSEGAKVYLAKVLLEPPAGFQLNQVEGLSSNVVPVIKNHRILVTTGALYGRIRINGNQILEIRIVPTLPLLRIVDCQALGLEFSAKSPTLPFYVAGACVREGQNTQFHITFPEEAEFEQSSLFESKGKGESWRVFDLGQINAATSEIAQLSLRYKGRSYVFTLTSLKKASNSTTVQNNGSFELAAGVDLLTFNSTGYSGSNQKFAVMGRVLPHLFGPSWGVGADISTVFGISQSPDSITYFQLAPYGFYRFNLNSTVSIDPRVYFVIASQAQAKSSIAFSTNQVGVGVSGTWILSSDWISRFELMTESVGSPVIKSHLLLDLNVHQRPKPGRWGWGGGVQIQNYTVMDSTSHQDQFGQTMAYGLAVF